MRHARRMLQFSANLGFLWKELELPDAIRAAKRAGFDAVECHWPFEYSSSTIHAALSETGLAMLSLNTVAGNKGETGLAALPGREVEAKQAIDQAINYASSIDTHYVHVMAGAADGNEATAVYLENLRYACKAAKALDISVLIEPINHHDMPGYFLHSAEQALQVLQCVDASNLKIMFDCYHMQRIHGDLNYWLEALLPHIGHIQIASVPLRAEPGIADDDNDELDYAEVFATIERIAYTGMIGAEYKPATSTEAGLGWLEAYRM